MNKKGLPDGWKEVKLGEVANILMGQSPKSESYNINGDGVPFYQGVTEFTDRNVKIKTFTNQPKKVVKANTILFSVRAPVGRVNFVRHQACIGRGNAGIVMKNGLQNFLFYLLKYIEKQIQSYTSGTVFTSINSKDLKNLPIKAPPLPEQQKIAEILSSLDDKIELNNQMNKNLENMAQTIFKHWFVDFEFPDENGKPYASNGGKFVKSEMGLIPEGWRVGRINDVAEVIGGGTPSRKVDEYFTEKGIPWITPKDLSSYNKKFIERGSQDISSLGLKKSSAKLMPKDTVLFSSRAPIGYIVISKNEVSTNQGFKSLIPKNGFGVEYIYYLIKYIRPLIENRASGSTFKEISGGEMKKISVIIPNEKILKKFESILNSSSSQMLSNEEEVENLIQIRDSLLPKLMSGEIRVGDMEK